MYSENSEVIFEDLEGYELASYESSSFFAFIDGCEVTIINVNF